jgi:transposase-like protein
MVTAVRRGASLRDVARRFDVSVGTVHRWVQRAAGQRLDRVDWTDRSHRPCRIQRTPLAIEELVLAVRQELRNESDLGEFGARAIHRTLVERQQPPVPAVRTIGRILQRCGALDGRKRQRRPPPPRGWYLPDVAGGQAELDSFDVIEDLIIEGGIDVAVLTGISVHGGLPAAWPGPPVRARTVVDALVEHWQAVGLPRYAQFDNATCFQGAHQFPDTVGRVSRLCLSLGVVPVFVPPRETGFQGAIEGYNSQWLAKVWHRFHHADHTALAARSVRYVTALRARRAARIDAAPPRRRFPRSWQLDLQARPRGRMIYLRRADAEGVVQLLGHAWCVAPHWSHRLVRAEVDFDRDTICLYSLRRRAPSEQPLLRRVHYRFPREGFTE